MPVGNQASCTWYPDKFQTSSSKAQNSRPASIHSKFLSFHSMAYCIDLLGRMSDSTIHQPLGSNFRWFSTGHGANTGRMVYCVNSMMRGLQSKHRICSEECTLRIPPDCFLSSWRRNWPPGRMANPWHPFTLLEPWWKELSSVRGTRPIHRCLRFLRLFSLRSFIFCPFYPSVS